MFAAILQRSYSTTRYHFRSRQLLGVSACTATKALCVCHVSLRQTKCYQNETQFVVVVLLPEELVRFHYPPGSEDGLRLVNVAITHTDDLVPILATKRFLVAV